MTREISEEERETLQRQADIVNFIFDYPDEIRAVLGTPPVFTVESILRQQEEEGSRAWRRHDDDLDFEEPLPPPAVNNDSPLLGSQSYPILLQDSEVEEEELEHSDENSYVSESVLEVVESSSPSTEEKSPSLSVNDYGNEEEVEEGDFEEEFFDASEVFADVEEELVNVEEETVDVEEETVDVEEESFDVEEESFDVEEESFDVEEGFYDSESVPEVMENEYVDIEDERAGTEDEGAGTEAGRMVSKDEMTEDGHVYAENKTVDIKLQIVDADIAFNDLVEGNISNSLTGPNTSIIDTEFPPVGSFIDIPEETTNYMDIVERSSTKRKLDEETSMQSSVTPADTRECRKLRKANNSSRVETEQDDQSTMNLHWLTEYHRSDRSVLLLGKYLDQDTNEYRSCSVCVKNIAHEVYILPREFKLDFNKEPFGEKITMENVKAEVEQLLCCYGITDYSVSVAIRKYAFGASDVPREGTYLKLVYRHQSFRFPKTDGVTFSHTFGADTDPLDQLLIANGIKGPCWLQIRNFENVQMDNTEYVYTSMNVTVPGPEYICVATNPEITKLGCPPLNILSLSFETILNNFTQEVEIVAASLFSCQNVDIHKQDVDSIKDGERTTYLRLTEASNFPFGMKEYLTKEAETNDHNIVLEYSERSMLQALIGKIGLLDPDVIVGHNLSTVYLDVLFCRMKTFSTLYWQKLGRLGFLDFPKIQANVTPGIVSYQERLAMSGRIICDTSIASQDLIKSKSFHLSELASSQLNIERENIKSEEIPSYFSSHEGIIKLANHCSTDAQLSYFLMTKLQILPISKQLTNLAGNTWAKNINGNRLERNEYLLLHTFYKEGYVVPDRPEFKKDEFTFANEEDLDVGMRNKNKEKGRYAGGLVLEPKKGFYDNYVALLDFNSLYPSIIREFNVCFTTMDYQNRQTDPNFIPDTPDGTVPTGVLPRLVKVFVERRQHVKRLMKNRELPESILKQYDIEQLALKLTANSMYGCLGSSLSRFHAMPLASYITSKGRQILQETTDMVIKDGVDVIYGDTDSIMINTALASIADARLLADNIKRKINEKYNLLEIDVEKFFKRTLLLQKKKYAGLAVAEGFEDGRTPCESIEIKGLDLVRRDWCELSQKVSRSVLELILSTNTHEEIAKKIYDYLYFITNHAKESEFELEDFSIYKRLSKPIEEYTNSKRAPHVIVAKDMRKSGNLVRPGDTIAYVMCTDTELGTRPHMVDDVVNAKAEIDINWYLRKQLLPPVLRLCKEISTIDLAKIAKCFDKDAKVMDEQDEVESGPFADVEEVVNDDRTKQLNTIQAERACRDFIRQYYAQKMTADELYRKVNTLVQVNPEALEHFYKQSQFRYIDLKAYEN